MTTRVAAAQAPAEAGAAPGTPRRGLVLGGGGMLGAAWTVGALCAVEEATGRPPGDAEVLLGTSAGSILGALLAAGARAEQLRDHQRGLPITDGPLAEVAFDYDTAVGGALPPRPRAGIGSPGLLRDAVRHPREYPLLTMVSAVAPHGRGSLAPVGELVRGLLGADGWPEGSALRVAAVDYRSGRRVVFGDPDAPAADVAEAVMASCAIPGWFAPVRLNGSAYVDGGCWSATNADLLLGRGLDEVYVLAPMALRLHPRAERAERGSVAALREWRARDRPRGVLAQLVSRYRRAVTRQLLREAALLRAEGVRVRLLAPTLADLAAMGPNMMDPARRGAVLESALRTSREALAAAR
ncbi:patatin-like phospholipase family protein [Streptomyces kaniharaensis]|uniref:Patatin-like phospholipase family protein n=1 Tax=Streptomyces kaniharaensis TaxID=212423 RepID=A0A6N7KM41_9ACTN|nr:patatin-like phospholipase family protein [Streptomyces kaniharaensis]MQS12471.1 patatin-like phospholipase family protein [Streptomyces kaniharaensis]